MHLRKLAGAPATALAIAALAGCGSSGSSSSVTPAAYVKSICTAVTPFEADVVKRSDELNLTTLANAEQGKKAIQGFLSAVSDDTDRALSKLKGAGTPNVSNGKQLADTVVSAFTQLKAAVGHALAQAEALPTSSPEAFKTAATHLGTTVRTSMSGIGSSLDKLKSPELEKAAAKEPACTSLGAA
ncbi:MAG: hypothetical protein JOZ98_11030 [Solirubrobacterales bacterium]|nr:hypothetical protein [Solirubrobacterales bacterium]MBV9797011.1 hypothetical protein [Solirubrobacterales bacterium]